MYSNVINSIIGTARSNVNAGDMVSIGTGCMVTATYPTWSGTSTWSNSTSTPIEDILKYTQYIRKDDNTVWCSACGNAAGKSLVAKHICVYEDSPYKGGTERRITCVTLNFCGPECEVFWSMKNVEFLHEGIHGQGFEMENIEEQMKYFSCPANRGNPYEKDTSNR
jgi:hypothetical protein